MNNLNPNFITQHSLHPAPPLYPIPPSSITQSFPIPYPHAQVVNPNFPYQIPWNTSGNTLNQSYTHTQSPHQYQSPSITNATNNNNSNNTKPFIQLFKQISKNGGMITPETLHQNHCDNLAQNRMENSHGFGITNSSVKPQKITDSKSSQLSIREILSNIDRSYQQSSEVTDTKVQSTHPVQKQKIQPFAKKPNSVHVYSNVNYESKTNQNKIQPAEHKQKQSISLNIPGNNPIYSKIIKSAQKFNRNQHQNQNDKKNSRNIQQSNLNKESLNVVVSQTPHNYLFQKTSLSEFQENVSVFSNPTNNDKQSKQNHHFIRKIQTQVDQDADYQRKLKNQDDYYLVPHLNNVHKKIRNKIIAKSIPVVIKKVQIGIQVSQQLLNQYDSNCATMQVSPIHSKYSNLSPQQKLFFHPPPLTKDSQGLQQSQQKQSQQLAINNSHTQARLRALGFTEAQYGRDISIRLEQSVAGSQETPKGGSGLKTSLQNQLKGSNNIKGKNKKDLKAWHLQSVESIQTISDKDEQQNQESQQKIVHQKIQQSEQNSVTQYQQSLIAQSQQLVGNENVHYRPHIPTQKQIQNKNTVRFTESFVQPNPDLKSNKSNKSKSQKQQKSQQQKLPLSSFSQLSISQLINMVTSFSQLKQIISFQFQQFYKYIQKWVKQFTASYDRVLMEKQQSIFMLEIQKISLEDQIRQLRLNDIAVNKQKDQSKLNSANNSKETSVKASPMLKQFEGPAQSKFNISYNHHHQQNDKFTNNNRYKVWQQLNSMEQILSAQVYKMEAERDREFTQISRHNQSGQAGNSHQKPNIRIEHQHKNANESMKHDNNDKQRDSFDQYQFTEN